MKGPIRTGLAVCCLIACGLLSSTAIAREAGQSDSPARGDRSWVEPMRQVHGRFNGKAGTLACFGDSITVTMAFWSPLANKGLKNVPDDMAEALTRVKAHLAEECWRDWKGPKYGNNGRMTIDWAHENIDTWLEELNPETALIMFGTNDLKRRDNLRNYERKYREVVRKCLDNGTVVILQTIPPCYQRPEVSRQYAEVVQKIAREVKLPVSDFFGEVMRRRPHDWCGKMDKFKLPEDRKAKNYEVETLLSRDGVHPSAPAKYRLDFSEESLSSSGYNLRTHLALMIYADVLESVLKPE
ncbi:MAG: SGNH/GDSL hydrolase family protein [Planctomycetota bacterium]|jgi:lysophospholipase L1-like esterase